MDMTYNGWTNKPTWLVNMWLTNDHRDERWIRETADKCCRNAEDKDDAISAMADELACYVDAIEPEVVGLMADLLSWALAMIEWREMAAHHIDDIWDDVHAEVIAEDIPE